MSVELFGRGLVIGFAIAAPVGPIGLLCIQRTLRGGRLAGLVTGLGAASADAIYGLIAGLGLTAVAGFLSGQQRVLGLVGGLFLCYLGVRTLLQPPAQTAARIQGSDGSLLRAYASALGLTLTNPMTIFAFMAVFAGVGLAVDGVEAGRALALVSGVFLGSAAWWLILSTLAAAAAERLNPGVLQWVNRSAGVLLLGFGLYLLVDLWRVL